MCVGKYVKVNPQKQRYPTSVHLASFYPSALIYHISIKTMCWNAWKYLSKQLRCGVSTGQYL